MRVAVIVLFCAAQALAATTNYFELHPARFQQAATRELVFEAINYELLAACVLRETNIRRQQSGLRLLKHNAKAMAAARTQSEIMRKRGAISHVNPESAQFKTLDLRVKATGLKPRLMAENVATAFGLQYQSGALYFPDRVNGKMVFRHKPGAPPIPPHSYASFAKALVDAWMGSKGHRENILLKEAEALGSFCSPVANGQSMPMFYCTQVFVAGAGE